jgi:hypothetical protein
MKAVSSFYDIGTSTRDEFVSSQASPNVAPKFSTHESISPKEFLAQKQPRTDVERVACLAYYLTHYRQTANFKTLDLAKINTEAAHPKFSNAAYAANNATNAGYLAPAQGGLRQISAAGEQYVHTLPDRDAAKAAMSQIALGIRIDNQNSLIKASQLRRQIVGESSFTYTALVIEDRYAFSPSTFFR